MREPQAKAIHLKDYTPPAFRVETVELDVDIRDDHALVKARLQIARNAPGPLVLDGDDRLYLHRYFDYEQRLARRLVRATGAAPAAVDA